MLLCRLLGAGVGAGAVLAEEEDLVPPLFTDGLVLVLVLVPDDPSTDADGSAVLASDADNAPGLPAPESGPRITVYAVVLPSAWSSRCATRSVMICRPPAPLPAPAPSPPPLLLPILLELGSIAGMFLRRILLAPSDRYDGPPKPLGAATSPPPKPLFGVGTMRDGGIPPNIAAAAAVGSTRPQLECGRIRFLCGCGVGNGACLLGSPSIIVLCAIANTWEKIETAEQNRVFAIKNDTSLITTVYKGRETCINVYHV